MYKVLLSGCSFSDYCGWGEVGCHSDPRCWYNIVAAKHQLDLTNIGYGGQSNREIIHKAGLELISNPAKYHTVIIQLTSTHRHWFFRNDDRSEFCIVNGGNVSNTKTLEEKNALSLIQLEFSNRSVEIEKDLVSLLMLQSYCQQHNIKLILINAMDAGRAIADAELGELLDLSYSIGFDTSLIEQQIDYADDDIHPGENSNRIYAELVSDVITQLIFSRIDT
jgi:hypothetical protein